MKKNFRLVLVPFILSSFVFISCASIKEIPDDKTAAQIIQMGQNAAFASDYKSAEFCYNTAIERFGTERSVYLEAKYELGRCYLKQKKYEKSYQIMSELLELYDVHGTALPGAYKKLSQICISQIPEKKLADIQAKQKTKSSNLSATE